MKSAVVENTRADRTTAQLVPRGQGGFTIVELMIVVLIMAILAAIAIVAYQDYTNRTKMLEVVLAASACRTPVTEVYMFEPSPPADNDWGCGSALPSTQYVQSVTVDSNGKIIAVARGFNNSDIDGKQVTLTPLINGNPASSATDMGQRVHSWRCGSGDDGTDIPDRFLPFSCR